MGDRKKYVTICSLEQDNVSYRNIKVQLRVHFHLLQIVFPVVLITKTAGYCKQRGWSGGAMVLGKLPVSGRPTISMTVGQGPTALAVGAGGGCLDIFTLA